MPLFSRKIATVVTGLAIMVGTGGAALADSMDERAGGDGPVTPIGCEPARPLPPGTPHVPAQPIDGAPAGHAEPGTPEVPAEPIGCQPTRPLPPGTPHVPAQPIGGAPAGQAEQG
ncbi:hypothetical protein CFN78_12400 [Amycolatopsis antarctica]|uniref:Uncharacterized protein n=1 Tax=Amycolatopsis antarctica TaxID=1854586 RepID=A0A263D3H3_9PSEU|nr:hypothetical protein [Amycolatopsis antarctica]OZM73024.1 hypothetical protein CFN78_12400 [Amycolatopsis antarctica]